jgi:hypothetical protein
LDGGKFSSGVLNTVGVAKGIFKDLHKSGEVFLFHRVIFDLWRDLVEGVILETVDSKTKFLLGRGEGGLF